MKKISLEHSIRNVVLKEEERERFGNLPVYKDTRDNTSEYIGPNAGPLGFGVYPQGVPSVKNTERLSPYVPNTRPLDLQKQQQQSQPQPQVQSQQPKSSETTPDVKTSTSVVQPRKVKTIKINPDGSVKNESYNSLEHLIRNIVSETVGNIVSPKESHPIKIAFNKPVHIEPPKGEEHGDINALNVSNQRKQIKQTQSSTSGTFAEGVLNERGLDVPIPKVKPPKPIEVKPKPDVEIPAAPPAEIPITPKPVKTVPVKPDTEVPAPAKPDFETPTKPAKPAKPDVETSPNDKVEPKAEPQTDVKADPKVDPKTDPKAEPKAADPKVDPKDPKTGKKFPIPFIFGGSDDTVDVGKDAAPFPVKTHVHGAGPRSATDPTHLGTATAKQILKRIPMKEENQEDRKKIEYVPRSKLNAKASLGRLSAVKTRIIDEEEQPVQKPSRAAKIKSIVLDKKQTGMGENPIVEKEPRLKPLHLGEAGIVRKITEPMAKRPVMTGVAGGLAGGAVIAPETTNNFLSGAVEKAGELGREAAKSVPKPVRDTVSSAASSVNKAYNWAGDKIAKGLDKVNPLLEPGKRNEKGDYVTNDPEYHHGKKDTAAMFGSLVPGPTGTASGIYGAKRALQRGDYGDAFINAAGAIPGAGTIMGAARVPAALAKTAAKASTGAKVGATGMVAHDMTDAAVKLSDPASKSKDEDDTPAQTPAKPTVNDAPSAVAAEPKKQNKSMFDPTPIKNQGN